MWIHFHMYRWLVCPHNDLVVHRFGTMIWLSALSEAKDSAVHSSSDADDSSVSLGMFQYS